MTAAARDELNTIRDALVSALNPSRIYLFGSFASGREREESDFDIYVVMPDGSGDSVYLTRDAYKALRGKRKRPVDIIVGTESSFNSRSERNTIERSIADGGVILYG